MSHDSTPAGASDGLATGEITDHVYDGIQEYDNPLPGWWTAMFYATIVFSIGYGFFAFARPDWTNVKVMYDNAKAAAEAAEFERIGELSPDKATMMAFLTDPERMSFLSTGEAIFQTNCASCHNKNGSGISGANLTDDHYINVKKITDILSVIEEGRNGGAMPAWGNRLSENQIILVGAYVASLRGGYLDGKEAQGEELTQSWAELPE